MNIKSLGESRQVSHLKYITSKITCLFHDSLSNKKFRISINCPIRRACFYSNMGGSVAAANCYFEETKSLLGIDKGGKYFIAQAQRYMEPILDGSIVALGLHAEKYPYLFSIRTPKVGNIYSGVFLAVALQNFNDIEIIEIADEEWLEEDRIVEKILEEKNGKQIIAD